MQQGGIQPEEVVLPWTLSLRPGPGPGRFPVLGWVVAWVRVGDGDGVPALGEWVVDKNVKEKEA